MEPRQIDIQISDKQFLRSGNSSIPNSILSSQRATYDLVQLRFPNVDKATRVDIQARIFRKVQPNILFRLEYILENIIDLDYVLEKVEYTGYRTAQ